MRDKWYADKRDLVKWSGIMHILDNKRLGIQKVFQIAYYRQTDWPLLDFNGIDIEIPEKVLQHFRDIRLIKQLDPRIEVFNQYFDHKDRKRYVNNVCEMLRERNEKKIVFLDPDTGLEPSVCEVEHVKREEIGKIFNTLKQGDFLVFYQHKFWNPKWDEIRLSELAEACGLSESKINTWKADKIANDVVFFFVKKEDSYSGNEI